MAFWDTGLAQLRALWGTLTRTQRVVLVGVTAALAAGFLSLAFWANTPNYAVLYGKLAPEDAGEIVQNLQGQNVPYRLEDGGRAILVPADRVYDLRLKLASEGVPQGGVVGFEIFDKSSFGMTDFAQKVNYTRALEGELTRTIRRLDGVEGARVHLVLPERRLFEEQATPASASVVLQLSPGGRLSPKQVQGVVFLVSSSVEGLTPEKVTVVDTRGNLLYRASGDEGSLLASNQIEFKRAFEKDVERRVREMLEHVLGTGSAVVQVASHFDFDKVEETSETYNPDNTAVRSEQRTSEEGTSKPAPAGVPGVASNVGKTPQSGTVTPSSGASNRESETINYEVSKKVTKIQRTQGVLKRLSVAVAVDGTYREAPGKKEKQFVPRSPEELAKIRALVEKAVGFDASRGDQVEVTSIPFKPEEPVEVARAAVSPELYWRIAKYGVALFAFLIAVFAILRPLLRWVTQAPPAPEVSSPLTVAEMERQMAGEGEAVAEYKLDEKTPEETLKRETLRKRIVDLVREEPEIAAQLVRSWIAED